MRFNLTFPYHELSSLNFNVPGTTFNGMPRLTTLSLAKNEIGRLHSFDLVDLPSLRVLRLNGNRIEDVAQLALASLPQLQHLILSRNRIKELQPGVFNQMTSLQTLDLSRNELSSIPARFFSDFAGLQVLNVSGNFISELDPDDSYVRVKSSLQTLDLSSNCIGTIPKKVFAVGTTNYILDRHACWNVYFRTRPRAQSVCNRTTGRIRENGDREYLGLGRPLFLYDTVSTDQ